MINHYYQPIDNTKQQERLLEELLFGKLTNESESEESDHTLETVSGKEELNDRVGEAQIDAAVWRDDDEDAIEVDLDSSARLKKLKKSLGGASKVSGRQLTALLQER